LAENIFTNVRNVRFKDGAVRKIEGEVLLNNISIDLGVTGEEIGKVRYIAVWENPNKQPFACYYIFVADYIRNGVTVGQKIFVQDHDSNITRDITPSSLTDGFEYTTDGWQHTLFSGGFAFIINNGLNKPHYILDAPGNTGTFAINNLVLAELPGWDSYNVNQEVYNDTFSASSSEVFDLGQKVDFSINSISVTGTNTKTVKVGSPAGTNTPNSATFVPGDLPSSIPTVTGNQYEIYTDPATNTTVIVVGGLTVGDEVIVSIESRNPVNVRCGIIQSFNNLLVAGDLTEVDNTDDTKIIRRLSGVVRTSDVAIPGGIPNNWDPFAAGVSTADEFTLSETNVIQEMKSLQGNLYIYSTDSIHVMRLTGNTSAPVAFAPVTDEYGCLSTGGVVEYDGRHFVVGNNDIYVFAGNPGDIKSLAEGRVAQYFFNNLSPIHEQQLFLILNHLQNEIWICYPTLNSFAGECDEALIWSYRQNTWTIRDLNNVTSGDYGPVKGGGIPKATLTISNDQSGNAGYTNVGKREVQTVTINGDTPKVTGGTEAIKTITVGATSFTTDVQEVVDISVTGDTGPNVVNSVETLEFPSGASFTYDYTQANYLDGGASAIINGDSSIGSVSFPAISVLGTDYSDGDTITIDQFVAAVRDYINDNLALSDFTATATTNTLTLTSDVPGPRTFSTSTFSISGGTTSNLVLTNTTAGVGIYGISTNLSPAISMNLSAPAVAGVHAAINETITLDKNLTSQTAIRDDIISKLSANSVFDGSASSIYSVEANGNNVRLISTYGGNHSAITISYETSYSGTTYSETQFGGNLTDTVTVATTGVDNSTPIPTLTVTFPNGDTDSVQLTGTHNNTTIASEINTLITANSNWASTVANNVVTATASAVGPVTNNFSVSLTSINNTPSVTFTYAQTRAGVLGYGVTDRVTLTPPVGDAITVNFDNTTNYPIYDPNNPSSVAEVTAAEIAEALETAWTDTTYFTVTRASNVLTFTGTNRGAITGSFAYTIDQGDTRTGTLVTPLIADSTASDINVTDGVDQEFASLTRVTLTVDSATGDPEVIFDKHYGEGPGRLLDPDFTPGINDNIYGDTAYTNDADYLNAYYDPEKDLNRTNTTEQAKDNGETVDIRDSLLDLLTEIDLLQYLIVTPDSTSAPTTIDIEPSQFSNTAKYVSDFSPWVPVGGGPLETGRGTIAPSTTNLIAQPEGNNVTVITPSLATTGSSISTDFDVDRSWATDEINPSKLYPIFAQSGYDNETLFNRIRAGDIGYTFAGSSYVSFFEKTQMSVSPNIDTETIEDIALYADGGTITEIGGDLQRSTLQIRVRATNYPGQKAYLTTIEDNTQSNAKANKLVTNDFVVGNDYKLDINLTGRFLNYRIDDANSDISSAYTGSNDKGWNISGLQIGILKGGRK
jgi:hypothetical protein